ncbi:MAG: DUF47 domain-containing protein [Candidatus Thorarchaeota archaeon]
MVIDNGRFMASELGNITQMLEEHFRIALSSNRIVASALPDWLCENKPISPDDLKKTTEYEERADELKRHILTELAKANALLQREDLVRLVHYTDKLVDGAEIACHHLDSVIKSSWTPSGELKEMIKKLGELLMDEIKEAREAVRFLSINMENSMKKADEICVIEKQIDVLMREIVSFLYPLGIDIGILLRFRDFLNMMEDIANFCEDVAITIRSLSLTLNT